MGYINVKDNNIIIASCNEARNNSINELFINAINDRNYFPIFTYYNCFNSTNHYTSSLNNMNLEKRNKIDNRILAGDGLYAYDEFKKTSKLCSAGFWARRQPNRNYIATAGHCYYLGLSPFYLLPWNSTSTTAEIGEMPIHYLEPIDFGLINIDIKKIQPIPCVRNTDSERYKELFIEDVILASNNGAHLCLSGIRSHVKCGYVAALNGFTSNGVYFRDNIFVVNLRYIPGDSGGAIFYYKNLTQVSLNGIVQGGLFDFNDNINGITGVITLRSILNEIEDLEVVTTS
ncbi:hypothetical protein F8M41_008464 [Gigaspora margarita]|uniref:Serine protease n=1 Tax=Gigaspora margarita TaxID=4874 RepID=A0A8H4AVM3_GIGMA|nr:hypothetical protein F8M41_008464 [Gigaspora margarita]